MPRSQKMASDSTKPPRKKRCARLRSSCLSNTPKAMLFFDLLKLSLRMFKARTMRTLLTILGMSIGIAAIMFLVSFGYGLQRTLLQKITTSDALVTLDITLAKTDGAEKLDNAAIEALKAIPNIADVIPVLELAAKES